MCKTSTNGTERPFSDALDVASLEAAASVQEAAGVVAPQGTALTAEAIPADSAKRRLFEAALASGHIKITGDIVEVPLSGGNTAESVSLLRGEIVLVLKQDSKTPKLAAEGETIARFRNDLRLPARFRDAWPQIYAIESDGPYAYAMEYLPREAGWLSLEDRLYPAAGQEQPTRLAARRYVESALDVLFDGYAASIDRRRLPNIEVDYIERIADRLAQAAKIDDRFIARPLCINGQDLEPWTSMLERLKRHSNRVKETTPPFSTAVHGDPNPGNILLRESFGQVEVRMIDPKEWESGDYLFDIAKLTHFMVGTGPVEKQASGQPGRLCQREDGETLVADYTIDQPCWTDDVVNLSLNRVADFAESRGDLLWHERYHLGVASNLLGLPVGRLTHKSNPRPEAAFILYAEGLKWLALACDMMEV